MSRNYPADTQIQNFLTESYRKEENSRLQRFFRNKQAGNEAIGSKQFDVFRKKIEAAAPKPNERLLQLKETKPKSYHKRIVRPEQNFVNVASQSQNKVLLVDMWEVPPVIRQKLYDGFTKEGKGRYQYLQSRYHTIPERKYQFPTLSSWDYGWRLGDVSKPEEIKKPTYGRTRIVADTFYTRTGAMKTY